MSALQRATATVAVFMFIASVSMSAQGQSVPQVSRDIKQGKSGLVWTFPTSVPHAHARKPVPLHHLPAGRRPIQADAAVQASFPASNLPTNSGLSFDGIGDGLNGFTPTSVPPDSEGAVGLTQYVEWVNTSFAVFDKKSGALLTGPTAGNLLWSSLGTNDACYAHNDGDPNVQYDKIAHRWILTQFANIFSSTGPYYECVAVSTSDDATGSYNLYEFQYSDKNDYPKLGVWPDAYYIVYNMYEHSSDAFLGGKVCALDRIAMLAGNPATQVCFMLDPPYGAVLPSDLDGLTLPPNGSPNYLAGYDVANSLLNIFQFHVDFATPANSTLTGPSTVAVPPFNEACIVSGGTCSTSIVPQPGTTQKLDSLGDRPMYRLAYRNFGDHESLLFNNSVLTGSGNVGVRWYELRSPGSNPTIYQGATLAPDSANRWMASMAMDGDGNIAMGYSVSDDTSIYPSIRYTGRLVSDTLSTMQSENTILTGTASQTSHDRWGDYTSMVVDPANDCTFWYSNEYIPTTGSFNWRTRIATFSFPSCFKPPVVNSATPSSGNGNSHTFVFSYSDPNGYADLSQVKALVGSGSNANSCYLTYTPLTNSLQLLDDSGATNSSPVVLGTATTLQNSQCTVDVSASSAAGSGTTLNLILALSFDPTSYTGTHNLYMFGIDNEGATTGWQSLGTWQVGTNYAPTVVSSSPSGGSGNSQTFTFSYADANGYTTLSQVKALIGSGSNANSCYFVYTPSVHALQLLNDAGNSFSSPAVLGTASTLQNSQCTVNLANSSASGSGTTLNLSLALTFNTSTYSGTHNIFMYALDNGGLTSGWQNPGTWIVGPNYAPTTVSASPSSGSGSSQTFAFTYSDPNGYTTLLQVKALIGSGSNASSCYVVYNVPARTLQLLNDAGTIFSAPVAIGSATTLQNSQCTVNVASSSASGSGTTLTLTLALTFNAASYPGTQNLLMLAYDSGGLSSGWQSGGTWTVGTNYAPTVVSASPNSGSGGAQTFVFSYSDANGYNTLSQVKAQIGSGANANSCYLIYTPGGNAVQLMDDTGTTYSAPGVLGTAGTLQNSQCAVNLGESSASGTGSTLNVSLSLTFRGTYQGSQTIWMFAVDNGGLNSGWQVGGSWTP